MKTIERIAFDNKATGYSLLPEHSGLIKVNSTVRLLNVDGRWTSVDPGIFIGYATTGGNYSKIRAIMHPDRPGMHYRVFGDEYITLSPLEELARQAE